MKVKKKSILICFIGGILMLIGSVGGLQIFILLIELYFEFAVPYVSATIGPELTSVLNIFLTVIFLVILGGGISVIIGTILVIINLYKIGKLIISLGSGMGLIGILFFIAFEITFIGPINTWEKFGLFALGLLLNLYFIGVIITIIGRRKMKKISEAEEEVPQVKIVDYNSTTEKIKCPVCNLENIKDSKYCGSCGFELSYALESRL
ncbi:MAG: hypothetical protein ACFE8A_14700 [Candidatus Hodarchaeota archaeon]